MLYNKTVSGGGTLGKKKEEPKIVLGLDQSYTKTGASVSINGKLVAVKSWDFNGLNKTQTRNRLRRIVQAYIDKYHIEVIMVEKIRTFSRGFLSTGYIKSTGALVATIVDVAYENKLKVYSCDTRSWKSQIVGTSKPKKVKTAKGTIILDPKEATKKFVKGLGFDVGDDDDAADSACISLYWFSDKKKIKLEQ
jgi:hypothetical protein